MADSCEMMLRDTKLPEIMAKEKPGLYEQIREWITNFAEKLRKAFTGVEARHEEARAMMQYAEEMQQIWDNALAGAVRNTEAANGTETVGENVKYSYRGTRDDGVEVYETSAETRALSDSEKKKKYMQMMREQYSGRTAKFEHDGEVDYARFTGDDMRKDMYGDQRSDVRGQKAKLNVAADGDIFTLVENASYSGSEAEQGKDTKAHRNVISWDYYVKTVQIDGRMYDVLANIRKTADDSYVYSIQMNTRKTKEAALPRKAQSPEGKSFQKRARATSTESIPQSGEESNPKFSMRDTAYTTAVESGNTEDAQRLVDEAAEEALENSEARLTDRGEFRMGAGKLATVYHATYNDFTVFDRARLGENTDAYASDESTAATAHLGFWFNTQPLSQSASYAGGKDVKAWLGALRAATAVGSRAPCGACGLKFLLFCVGMYLIWSRLAWGALCDTGIKEVMEKVTEDKANMLSHSDQIFSNAEYLYSLPGYEGNLNIYRWNYFYTPVQIGDTTVGVRIAIRDMVMPAESQIYSWGIKRPQPWTVAARRKPPCPPVPHQQGKQTPPWTVQGAYQAMAVFPAVSHRRRRKLPLPLPVYPRRRRMSSFTTCGVCGLK